MFVTDNTIEYSFKMTDCLFQRHDCTECVNNKSNLISVFGFLVAAPKPPASTSKPQPSRTYQKSRASNTANKPKQSNVKTTKKRKFSDTALPPMPRTPKTPTKISRIIPPRKDRGEGSEPRTPTRKKGTATFAAPRTPTFEMYGIKQMLSQKSTPGISPGKILRKLRHKTGGGGQPHGAGSERRDVEISNLPLQVCTL